VSVWLGAVRALRRVTPAPIRARLREFQFTWLRLEWTFPTGVEIRIADYGDWVIYSEIFASGDYDLALARACDRAAASGRSMHVVDLGANSGLFTLRVLHEARRRTLGVAITAVEAHPRMAERFLARVLPQRRAGEAVRLAQGVAGERGGAVDFYENPAHPASSTRFASRNAADRSRTPFRLSYVDLSAILSDAPRIDLLKCDIEGSEERVIANYADVFARTDVAVFEFHRDLCDVARCQALLRSYGFGHAATCRDGLNFIYAVWR